MFSIQERIMACFTGVITGDAIGKQTETLTHEDIKTWYPNGISDFHGEIGEVMPRYKNRHYEYRFGETTDDSEQTIAIARVIANEGKFNHTSVGRELMTCKKSNRLTLQLGKFQQFADPNRITYDGSGCGAAMRVAPIGAFYKTDELDLLLHAVFEASIPTHGSQEAICAASAIAAAISAAVDAKDRAFILDFSIYAAKEAEKYSQPSSDNNIATIISEVFHDISNFEELTPTQLSQKHLPLKTHTIIPLAIALALITGSAEKTTLLAANIGGDTDSVASMGAAIAGAMFPNTINDAWFNIVKEVNGNELMDLAPNIIKRRISI